MRFVASFIFALLLTACVSAPASGPGTYAGDDALVLCSTKVSNAPALDRRGRVAGYDPIAYVKGQPFLRAPVEGCVSSGFGPRRGGAGSFHEGVDLYTGAPRPVAAGGDGVVSFVGSQRGYGRTVIIKHRDGVETRYGHLSSFKRGLRSGDRVRRGQTIGATGRSGNATAVHLHYEILIGGRPRDPLTVGR
ncbi:MAG: M23 family metallopeptidase [Pseudomonadota bacterium]